MKEKDIRIISIPVTVAIDKELSLKAKGLYLIIKMVLDTPDIKITKDLIRHLSGVGATSFNNTWNELKEKGYLEVKRNSNQYIYELK